MKDPRRLVDDPAAPQTLRALLGEVPRARSLDAAARRRIRTRLVALTAVPAATAAVVAVKTAAAAFVLAAGVTAVGVGTVRGIRALTTDEPVRLSPTAAAHGGPARGTQNPTHAGQPPAISATASNTEERTESAPDERPKARERASNIAPQPAVGTNAVELPTGAAFPNVSEPGILAAETELLERARHALGSDPRVALALAAEHMTRFRYPFLSTERDLIRVEALHRLGRDPEARALAKGLIAGDTRGLYGERLRRLLDPPDGPVD